MENPIFVPNKSFRSQILNVLASATDLAARDNLTVRLFLNDINPGSDVESGIFDFVEPSFSGGAEKEVSADGDSLIVRDPNTNCYGFALRQGPDYWFWYVAGADLPAPVTVYGYFIYNSDADRIVGYARFDTPIVLSKKGDFVEVNTVLGFLPENIFQRPQ